MEKQKVQVHIEKDIEPNNKPDKYVRRKGGATNNQVNFTIADMALGILQFDKEEMNNYELRSRILKYYGEKVKEDSLRITCDRLEKDEKIEKNKKGHYVFYKAKQTEDEYLEDILSKSIQVKDWEIPKLHKTAILFDIKRAKKMAQPNKRKGRPSIPLVLLQNPIHPDTIAQRWEIPSTSKSKSIKGGFQEKFNYNKSQITAQIYYSGSFQIHSDFSDDPKDIRLWLHYFEFLNGFFFARCNYYLKDFQDFLEARYEMNRDLPLDSVNTLTRTFSNNSSGKFCFTLRQFNTLARVYTKKIGDVEILRTEVGNEDGVPYNQFISEQLAMINGGVNFQFMIRGQYDTNKKFEKIQKNIDRHGLVLEYLLKENLKQKVIKEDLSGNTKLRTDIHGGEE